MEAAEVIRLLPRPSIVLGDELVEEECCAARRHEVRVHHHVGQDGKKALGVEATLVNFVFRQRSLGLFVNTLH